MGNLAVALHERGNHREAEELYRRILDVQRRLLAQEEHVLIAIALTNLGSFYFDTGRYDDAEDLLRQARAMRRKLEGERHPSVAFSTGWLGRVLYRKGEYKEAEALFLETLAMHREHLGGEAPVRGPRPELSGPAATGDRRPERGGAPAYAGARDLR